MKERQIYIEGKEGLGTIFLRLIYKGVTYAIYLDDPMAKGWFEDCEHHTFNYLTKERNYNILNRDQARKKYPHVFRKAAKHPALKKLEITK